MNSQLYTATSGLLVEERRLEMVANNLANLSTAGFRSQRPFSAVYQELDPRAGRHTKLANQAVALAGSYEVPGPGPVRMTGRALDVALGRDDLFAVETPAGRRYTRDGSLQVGLDGALTDSAGNAVLGTNGQPIDGLDADTLLTGEGRVISAGADVAGLLVVRDPGGLLVREGNNLYALGDAGAEPETVDQPQVQPGWLEGSGADALGEMILLIEAQRAFESYQKLITTTMNEVNRKAVNEIAG